MSVAVTGMLQSALVHHQAGRLSQAEKIYRDIIAIDPENGNALNLLGLIVQGRGLADEAEALFSSAIVHTPRAASFHFNLGILLGAKGDNVGAMDCYARAIALEPGFAEAYLNRGVLNFEGKRFADALNDFEKAVLTAPGDARAYFNKGRCCAELSNLADAEAALRCALALQPSYEEAALFLAMLIANVGRVDEGIALVKGMLEIRRNAATLSALGDLLRKSGDIDEALEAHKSAVAIDPDNPHILHNYGAALFAQARFVDAGQVFAHAIEHDPSFTKAYEGLAKVQECLGDSAQAISTLRHGLLECPGSSDIRLKLAYRELAAGQFDAGWKNYESRFSTSDGTQALRPVPPALWKGEDLHGKSILIWTEQGLGDEILYASMIGDVIARAGHCVIECSARLEAVFRRSFPAATICTRERPYQYKTHSRELDYQIPMASLGQFVRSVFAAFPNRTAFLKADAARTVSLRARYQAARPGNLLVGIAWRSGNRAIGAAKSARLEDWADILGTPGVTFVNLQYGNCTEDLEATKRVAGIDVLQDAEIDPLTDIDDFFAQVNAMDLVISTSNTAVHVAGSQGVPVWLLLSGSPGGLWYWFGGGVQSPWYRSMTVHRQSTYTTDSIHEFSFARAVSTAARDLLVILESVRSSRV